MKLCTKDSCHNKHYGKGLCYSHYAQAWRSRITILCSYPGCTYKVYNKSASLCTTHYKRNYKHGDPSIVRPKGAKIKEVVSYNGLHARVKNQRGKASSHVCLCGTEAREWAYDHKDPNELYNEHGYPYSLDVSHYIAMCNKCHVKFDALTPKKIRISSINVV